MIIRPLDRDDLSHVLALSAAEANAAHWTAAAYETLLARAAERQAVLLIAEAKTAVLGFLAAQSAGPDWELENLIVRPDARRQGLATALLSELITDLRAGSAALLLLEVRASNFSAREFYEQQGFTATALRRDYYRDPTEDAVLYSLHLD